MQQPQTVVQRNHRPHTVKGRPCLNQLALCPSQVSGNVRKLRESTSRPLNKEETCPFHFTIFLSKHDCKWYLANKRYESSSSSAVNIQYHYNHVRTSGNHLMAKKQDLSEDTLIYIRYCVDNHVATSSIRKLVEGAFKVCVPDSVIRSVREEAMRDICVSIQDDPRLMGPAQRLIAMFQSLENVSYLYVVHQSY